MIHICLLLSGASIQQVEELIHICLLLSGASIQQVEGVIHILYYRRLVTLVTPSCYPPLKVPNYFLNESSKITEKSTFVLTHFYDCF